MSWLTCNIQGQNLLSKSSVIHGLLHLATPVHPMCTSTAVTHLYTFNVSQWCCDLNRLFYLCRPASDQLVYQSSVHWGGGYRTTKNFDTHSCCVQCVCVCQVYMNNLIQCTVQCITNTGGTNVHLKLQAESTAFHMKWMALLAEASVLTQSVWMRDHKLTWCLQFAFSQLFPNRPTFAQIGYFWLQ